MGGVSLPKIARSYETDLGDLAYMVARGDRFGHIRAMFGAGDIDDQEAQERILDLLMDGRCRMDGDRGEEDLTWSLSERELATLASNLYCEYLGGR